ncbi:MAG: L-dopachrome tautomerase-related protein [Pseudoramibacter sp.]
MAKSGQFKADGKLEKTGDYKILHQWDHLKWHFRTEAEKKDFEEHRYYEGCMPAGYKEDSKGNGYLSVPRWNPGVPASFNRVVEIDGETLLEPYPSWEWNKEGNPYVIQSVLGYEIDENDVLWILDQGRLVDQPSADGSQKIIIWDLKTDSLIDIIKIDNALSNYQASFLNDIVVDNEAGYAYIADSGTGTDPLQGGLIIYNIKTGELRRVLHQHESTQDVDGFRFKIDGTLVWKDTPMRTGADGIALSPNKKTLYWCPLTGRNLYCCDVSLLQNFDTPESDIEAAVKNLGSKGTNTDGMVADNKGRVWYTMLEGMGMGYYNPEDGSFNDFISDKRMIWVDTPQVTSDGYLIFDSNQLHFLNKGELDYTKPDNLIVWKAKLEDDTKSYL